MVTGSEMVVCAYLHFDGGYGNFLWALSRD